MYGAKGKYTIVKCYVIWDLNTDIHTHMWRGDVCEYDIIINVFYFRNFKLILNFIKR